MKKFEEENTDIEKSLMRRVDLSTVKIKYGKHNNFIYSNTPPDPRQVFSKMPPSHLSL